MPIKDAADIDNNFAVNKSTLNQNIEYYDAEKLNVYGVKKIDGVYRRIEYDKAKEISEKVADISSECAGGRVRLITDSPIIAIKVKYRSVSKVPNYSFTATLGFDLYNKKNYIGCFVPPMETENYFESFLDVGGKERAYTLNFPVCSEIEELKIGVLSGSTVKQASEYKIKKPIVFYGSSITQGACASRPGNTYENILSRKLDCDYINLGFWGNAFGEENMARYISSINMSALVLDYDYNAPSEEHLIRTHERFFTIIREKQPTLPIIIVSAPKIAFKGDDFERFNVIKRTYYNAVLGGDKYVRFLSGIDMLKGYEDVVLADNIHLGDCGFSIIADNLIKILKEFI